MRSFPIKDQKWTDWANEQIQSLWLPYYPWMEPIQWVCWATKKTGSRVGEYHAGTKQIRLFHHVLKDASDFDLAAGDTILHEIIHHWQHCHPNTAVQKSPAHGPDFRKEMFRINALLEREAVTVYHQLRTKTASSKIEERLLKLLALAGSPNEHEASLAAATAARIAARYKVSLNRLGQSIIEECEHWNVFFTPRADQWRSTLWDQIATIHACKLWWNSSQGSGCRWYITGKPHSIYQAQIMGEYLDSVVVREASRFKGCGKGIGWLNSFRIGMANRLASRLHQQWYDQQIHGVPENKDHKHIPGLMVKKAYDQEYAETQIFMRGVKLHTRNASLASNYSGYAKGSERGNHVSLNRQAKGSTVKRLT